jgi:NAD(P)-dependent dehydrogenase (short-subunit alcohol dehydrogenase family)
MKQVLIVGGTGGLGSALVRQLLDQNLGVVVAGRSRTTDNRVRHSYVIDATFGEWRSLYTTIERESGKPIDAVVFVAGTAAYGRTALFPPERARSIFELNFWACSTAAKLVAEYWVETQRAGTFVAVLSIVARRGVPFEAYYSASKAAAARFLECLDLEYAAKGIRFVSAFPGTLNTPFRETADWYGIEPSLGDRGADVQRTAHAILKLLEGSRMARVIGWRERIIDLTDRLMPGLYDRMILRRRVESALKKGARSAGAEHSLGHWPKAGSQ